MLKFTTNQQHLFSYCSQNLKIDIIVKVLLRTYGGLFEQLTNINEHIISKKTAIPKSELIVLLNQLHKDGLINYKPVISNHLLHFLVPREDNYVINSITKNIKQRYKIKQQKIEAVLNFVQNSNHCRSLELINYFGEKTIKKCGVCDVCISLNKGKQHIDYKDVTLKIRILLNDSKKLSSKEITTLLKLDKNVVLTALQLLLDTNKITLTSHNKFELNSNA